MHQHSGLNGSRTAERTCELKRCTPLVEALTGEHESQDLKISIVSANRSERTLRAVFDSEHVELGLYLDFDLISTE